MAAYKIGTLLVKRFSKASTLKRKIFVMLGEEGTYTHRLVVRDAYGNRHTYESWRLNPVEAHRQGLLADIGDAQAKVVRAQTKLYEFDSQVKKIRDYFPLV